MCARGSCELRGAHQALRGLVAMARYSAANDWSNTKAQERAQPCSLSTARARKLRCGDEILLLPPAALDPRADGNLALSKLHRSYLLGWISPRGRSWEGLVRGGRSILAAGSGLLLTPSVFVA